MQQFNEQELSQLYLIALANDRYISALAKNILSAYYNYRFEPHQEGLETELIYGRGSNTKSDNTSIGLQSVIVYPNPADDHIIFEISEKEWIPKTIARVQVFDNLGKLVLSSSFDSRKERISTKGLNPNGLYFYQVISQGKTIGTGKFLVK